jgi:hypothetical protein
MHMTCVMIDRRSKRVVAYDYIKKQFVWRLLKLAGNKTRTGCSYKRIILQSWRSNLLEYIAVWSVESQPTFRRNISPPSSGSKNKQRKKPAELCLPPAFTLVSCSAYFLTLKMEATCSSETSVDFQRTTRRFIPDDTTPHNHCYENLKS